MLESLCAAVGCTLVTAKGLGKAARETCKSQTSGCLELQTQLPQLKEVCVCVCVAHMPPHVKSWNNLNCQSLLLTFAFHLVWSRASFRFFFCCVYQAGRPAVPRTPLYLPSIHLSVGALGYRCLGFCICLFVSCGVQTWGLMLECQALCPLSPLSCPQWSCLNYVLPGRPPPRSVTIVWLPRAAYNDSHSHVLLQVSFFKMAEDLVTSCILDFP